MGTKTYKPAKEVDEFMQNLPRDVDAVFRGLVVAAVRRGDLKPEDKIDAATLEHYHRMATDICAEAKEKRPLCFSLFDYSPLS